MNRTVFFALACCVALAVAAVVSILTREIVPTPAFAAKPLAVDALIGPSANSDGKRDKLSVLRLAPAPAEPPAEPAPDVTLRQAYAADSPYVAPGEPIAGPIPMPRARTASRPAIQKNYTLLSDMQIAALRERLRLTPAQQADWPNVEAALRAVAKAMHDKKQSNAAIEAESPEVEQLKTAATPLIAKLREDQKRDLRLLARLVGLESVASQM